MKHSLRFRPSFPTLGSANASALHSLNRNVGLWLGSAVCALAAALVSPGCERDFSNAPAAGDIVFSSDTVSFDTIYAGFPTPTLRVALRNVGDDDVTIGSVALAGGESSPFMVNINGVPSYHAENFRLCSGDSLLVFVSVRDASVSGGSAFRGLSDCIVATGGANEWRTNLSAVVRNVRSVGGVLSDDEQWLCDSIPYLVLDSVVVGRQSTLLVGPGVSVLMGGDATFLVEGKLVVAAEPHCRSSFTSVRSDGIYSSVPGQWGGLRISAGASADLGYCDVACASEALVCDSSSRLVAEGVWVRDASRAGVSLTKAEAEFTNSIVSDCGGGAFSAVGGRVGLRHVTVADYYSWDYRKVAALRFSVSDDSSARLEVDNSIITGSLSAEVEVDSLSASSALFRSSLVKAEKRKVGEKTDVFVDCVVATDAHFADRRSADFHLTEKSAAVGLADASLAGDLPTDFEGVLREADSAWCAGALQSVVSE